MIDIQTVSIAIASAGVLIGVVYYILDMRHQSKVRKTDLVMRLYERFGSTEFQKRALALASGSRVGSIRLRSNAWLLQVGEVAFRRRERKNIGSVC
jgi:hypothetical protein